MPEPSTSVALKEELAHIRELSKRGHHTEAITAAQALAREAPNSREALYLIAANQRCLNRITEALATLQRLEDQHPKFSLLYQERGHCYTTLRDASRAIEAFSQAVNLNPALPASWTMLERLYRLIGETKRAATAAEQLSLLNNLPPEVVRAGSLFSDGELSAAENILREYLQRANHVEALRLLARIEHHRNSLAQAECLLETALQLAPNYRAARLDYIRVLLDDQRYLQAHETIAPLLELDPAKSDLLSMQAAACAGLGHHDAAINLYRQRIALSPDSAEMQVAFGNSLKSVGLTNDAISAFRAAATLRPSFGDAWWSLANLKTYYFSDDEIAHMRTEESAPALQPADRHHLCFALGKALEDRQQYAESWRYYERGNAIKLAECHYRAEVTEANTRLQMEVCTAGFFAARTGCGLPDPDPIFIVGLPRSGSTLIEQILASHSQVDGTQELPDVPRIVRELDNPGTDPDNPRYPTALRDLAPESFCELGERYLLGARPYRDGKPFFIDKMPNNFRHIGLIQLMLPNAKIIDVRREPMACCFSNLKQLFASGQEFTYSVNDVASYYRTYLDLMRHWNAALPGKIFKVQYEDVVEGLAKNVKRILEFCGLEFEPKCLEFHKKQRAIATPSSEQVRQPLSRQGLDQWRNYEPWLTPLKQALGDAMTGYRG